MNKRMQTVLIVIAIAVIGLIAWFFVWYAKDDAPRNVVDDPVEAVENVTDTIAY